MVETLYSTATVAKRLGCADSTVRRICAKSWEGSAEGIGTKAGRAWLLTEADVERCRAALAERRSGNPQCSPCGYCGHQQLRHDSAGCHVASCSCRIPIDDLR